MIHVLVGDRGPLLTKLVEDLVGPPAPADLDSARIDASEASLDDIVAAATTAPFMGGRRKVVLQSSPIPNDRSKWFWDWLKALADSPPQALDLVVTVYLDGLFGSERKRIEERVRRLDGTGIKVQVVAQLSRSRGDVARQLVTKVAREEGLDIDPETAGRLVGRVELDSAALEQEVRKIAAFKAFSGSITDDDISAADPHPAEQAIWSYLDAIVEGRTGGALEVLGAALDQGEQAEFVTALLAVMLRRLILCRHWPGGRASAGQLASALGLPDWQARKLSDQASNFKIGELDSMLAALVELDFKYKTGRLAHGGLARGLEALTVRLCYRALNGDRRGGTS